MKSQPSRLNRMVAVIKGFHHSAAGLAKASVRPVNDADPGQLSGIAIDNFARPVGGTIVDDYPLRRRHGLALDGSDGCFDKLLFIAYWRNNYVSRHCLLRYRESGGTQFAWCQLLLSVRIRFHKVSQVDTPRRRSARSALRSAVDSGDFDLRTTAFFLFLINSRVHVPHMHEYDHRNTTGNHHQW